MFFFCFMVSYCDHELRFQAWRDLYISIKNIIVIFLIPYLQTRSVDISTAFVGISNTCV